MIVVIVFFVIRVIHKTNQTQLKSENKYKHQNIGPLRSEHIKPGVTTVRGCVYVTCSILPI